MKRDIAKEIYKQAHLEGKFLLRSGQFSNEYFDKYLFEANPDLLRKIAKGMCELIPKDIEVLAGLEMGGIPLVTAISLDAGIQCTFVRKKAKEYGTCKFAEGAQVSGRNICIVEDVVTTGGQIIKSANMLREVGAKVDFVLCAIQRNPDAMEILEKEGLTLIPYMTMEYIKEQVGVS
ncbi:MAG: orotate phosphoribosyltransferase [Lachnospiraceae bacterium]|nr:orotate phosphoribosyltransferase [Lachnospiraceae bacterium]